MGMSELCVTTDCSEKCERLWAWFNKIHEQHLEKKANLQTEIKELEMRLKKQEDKLGELQEYQKQVEMKQREEEAAIDTLKLEKKLLRNKNLTFENEIEMLKDKIEAAKNFQPSAKDTAQLQSCRLKYILYKDITGVRWDYKTKSPKGYVVNKKNCYLKPFSLESSNEDELWEEIAKSSSADWTAFSCEETE